MNQPQFLQLILLNPKEDGATWEDFEQDPNLLFAEFAKRYAVQAQGVNDNIIKSPKAPLAVDRGKLWIKSTWPYAIISLLDGQFQADWGLSGFMPNTPFLAIPFSPAKEYVRQLDSNEISKYGLTDTDEKASKRMRWHIFEPPTIEI